MSIKKIKYDLFREFDWLASVGSKMFLYPFLHKPRRVLFCYYFLYFLILLTFFQFVCTLILTGSKDWLEIVNIAPNMGVCLMAVMKYRLLHKNSHVYEKIFNHFKCDLWEVIPMTSIKENSAIASKYTYITRIVNKVLFIFSIILVIAVDGFPWLVAQYESRILGKDWKYLSPFEAWYPFDKVQWYTVTYVWESLMTALVIYVYIYTNMTNITVIICICMELKLLGNCLVGLITENDVGNIKNQRKMKATFDRLKMELKFIIERHIFLQETTTSLDIVLGDVMILSYLSGSVFICLTAFSFTVVDDLYSSIRYFFFFASLVFEVFNYCMVGQILVDYSVQLAEKIYSCNWIYADYEIKKILLFFMLRTQKPFRLTAKGYITMNLNTFSNVCSLSYQFFNLLRTLYNPTP